MEHPRITLEPNKMDGQPCIRGLRIPVRTIFKMLADNMTPQEILEDFPDLELEDIQAALEYAGDLMLKKNDKTAWKLSGVEIEVPLQRPA